MTTVKRNPWIVVVFLVVCLSAPAVRADTVMVGKLPYSDAMIVSVEDGELLFRASNSNDVKKALSDITKITLVGQEDFNQAETLYAAGKYAEAASAYDQVGSGKAYLPALVKYRRLLALRQTSRIDRSTREWLGVMEETKGSAVSVSLRPAKLAEKGSSANASAISSLKARVSSTRVDAERNAIRQLLLELYKAEGDDAAAGKLAQEIAGLGSGDSGTNTGTGTETTAVGGTLSGKTQALLLLIQNGKAKMVQDEIQGGLKGYTAAELPTALYLLGMAQYAVASGTTGKEAMNKLKTEAGVNFMRVAVLFRGAKEAPESLFMAGKICADLGNKTGAVQAWHAVVESYPTSPWCPKARDAVEDIKRRSGK